jgi:hypothetical protein
MGQTDHANPPAEEASRWPIEAWWQPFSPPEHVFDLWRNDLDVLRDEGGLMCLTLHPFVSSRHGPSRSIAWLLDYAVELGDVWIDRADRVARWWLKERNDPRASPFGITNRVFGHG